MHCHSNFLQNTKSLNDPPHIISSELSVMYLKMSTDSSELQWSDMSLSLRFTACSFIIIRASFRILKWKLGVSIRLFLFHRSPVLTKVCMYVIIISKTKIFLSTLDICWLCGWIICYLGIISSTVLTSDKPYVCPCKWFRSNHRP